jgi:hypothetical protein
MINNSAGSKINMNLFTLHRHPEANMCHLGAAKYCERAAVPSPSMPGASHAKLRD